MGNRASSDKIRSGVSDKNVIVPPMGNPVTAVWSCSHHGMGTAAC